MKKISFSIFYEKTVRILSIIAIIVLLRGAIWNIIALKQSPTTIGDIAFTILNLVTAFCFGILIIKPNKLSFCSMISIVYAIPNLLLEPEETGIGYFMFILFLISLYAQDFFKKWKRTKICGIILFFVLIMLINLVYGFEVFEEKLVNVIGYSLIVLVIILIFAKYLLESKHSIIGSKILDLRKFMTDGSLNDRDVVWLKMILNGDKYSAIARGTSVAEGTMRNRIREVFKILGVSDKKQFITIYDEALVITTQEEFQAWKDTLV
ncbi:MAG: hypothetical protein J5857_02010 [Treponema sp.]|nr:hypothetical protein [Treponema sp.]